MATVSFSAGGWQLVSASGVGNWATLFPGQQADGTMGWTCIYSSPPQFQIQQLTLLQGQNGASVIASAASPWTVGNNFFPGSSTGACATLVESVPFVVWEGVGGDNTLWFSCLENSQWIMQAQITQNGFIIGTACNAPAVITASSLISNASGEITVLVWPGSGQNGYFFSTNYNPTNPTTYQWTPAQQIPNFGPSLVLVPKMATRWLNNGTVSEILLFGQALGSYMIFDANTNSPNTPFVLAPTPLPNPAQFNYVVTSVTSSSSNIYPIAIWENGEIALIEDSNVSFAVPENTLATPQGMLSASSITFQGLTYLVLVTAGQGYYWAEISVSD